VLVAQSQRAPQSSLIVRTLPLSSLLILVASLLLAGRAHAEPTAGPWEPVSNKDGIVVERRRVDGTNLKEFVGRGVIAAPIARVLAVIRDADRRAEWMPNCGSSYLVEENTETRIQIAYHRTKAPWPVSDRDSVNRATLLVEPAKHRVYLPFEAIEYPKVAPVKGVVRMPFMRGHWILIPVDGGKATQAEYQVWANPGGILPDWIANLASKTLPRETIAGLRRQVTRVEYPAFETQISNSPEAKELFARSQ
jgi:hypothetical protein